MKDEFGRTIKRIHQREKARRRKVRPFRIRHTPFDPVTGKYFPLLPAETAAELPTTHVQVREFIIKEEHANSLKCISMVDGTETIVAKPWILRKDEFDGKVINDISYSYAYGAINVRTATGIVDEIAVEETQYITPDYFDGEHMLATPAEIYVSEGECTWVDVNYSGRCWAVRI